METDISPIVLPSKFERLTKVTPVSKYLALGLMVALPFMGGIVGYTFVPEHTAETQIPVFSDLKRSATLPDDAKVVPSEEVELPQYGSSDLQKSVGAMPEKYDVIYQCDFRNGSVFGLESTSTNLFQYKEINEGDAIDFWMTTWFFNGHMCGIDGIALKYDANNSSSRYLFYAQKDNNKRCFASISIGADGEVRVQDLSPFRNPDGSYNGGCDSYCGSRGGIGNEVFLPSYRLPASSSPQCVF